MEKVILKMKKNLEKLFPEKSPYELDENNKKKNDNKKTDNVNTENINTDNKKTENINTDNINIDINKNNEKEKKLIKMI